MNLFEPLVYVSNLYVIEDKEVISVAVFGEWNDWDLGQPVELVNKGEMWVGHVPNNWLTVGRYASH